MEEEHALKEEEEAAAIKMQSMWRAKEAKDEVAKKKAQHAAEMEELRQRGVQEKEIQALRDKQEQELAAMKVQALYRGRKARRGLVKKRELRRAELKKKTRENSRQMAATKIQGMYRSWKARQFVRGRKAELKAKFEVSNITNIPIHVVIYIQF